MEALSRRRQSAEGTWRGDRDSVGGGGVILDGMTSCSDITVKICECVFMYLSVINTRTDHTVECIVTKHTAVLLVMVSIGISHDTILSAGGLLLASVS